MEDASKLWDWTEGEFPRRRSFRDDAPFQWAEFCGKQFLVTLNSRKSLYRFSGDRRFFEMKHALASAKQLVIFLFDLQLKGPAVSS